ncbi:hypothetical protein LTR85_011071 [Meristemomyces frigidus]|nr:hypothetical protein LTR85_011071 [Meristemomyces frigidus]
MSGVRSPAEEIDWASLLTAQPSEEAEHRASDTLHAIGEPYGALDRDDIPSEPHSAPEEPPQPEKLERVPARKRLASQDIERLGTRRAGKMPAWEDQPGPSTAPVGRQHSFVQLADLDFSLDEVKIKAKMHDIYSSIRSLAFEELHDMGIDPAASTLFDLPVASTPGLSELYCVLLGVGLRSHQRQLIADTMPVADVTVALMGAFFCIEVFGASCLPTADHLLALVGKALGA